MENTKYYLDIEDFTAQYMLKKLEKGETPYASYTDLHKYAQKVQCLMQEKGLTAVLTYNHLTTKALFVNYCEYFTECPEGIQLNDGISLETLRKRFCGYLPTKLLLAYQNTDI